LQLNSDAVTQTFSIPPTLRGHYAGFVSRAIALIIDLLLIVITQILILLVTRLLLNFFGLDELASAIFEPNPDVQSSLLVTVLRWIFAVIGSTLLLAVYLTFFWTLIDQSIGQALMGLRVVRTDGKSMTLGASIRRVIGYYPSFIVLGLGFLWVLIDDRRQGWHDKLADTVVIYDWDARIGRRMRDWINKREAWTTTEEIDAEIGTSDAIEVTAQN
jgi:uncharacterized RDD family membrane protein YckC